MRIHIGSDHAGLELLRYVAGRLRQSGHEVIDHGPATFNPDDDYPAFCIDTAQSLMHDLAAGADALGIVIGGSGNGEQIAANKVKGIRAALVWNDETARLARAHNDANVLSIGSRQHSLDEAASLIEIFIQEPFSFGERHVRRIGQVARFEETGTVNRESTE